MDESLHGKSGRSVTGGARRVGAAIARAAARGRRERRSLHYRDSEADAAQLVAELNAPAAEKRGEGEGRAARADRAAGAGRARRCRLRRGSICW